MHPQHPFSRPVDVDDEFQTLELANGTAFSPTETTPIVQSSAFQPYSQHAFRQSPPLPGPIVPEDDATTLLSNGHQTKRDPPNLFGPYRDRDGYLGYTYGGRLAQLIARNAQKLGMAVLLVMLVGIIITVPVAVETSKWYAEQQASIPVPPVVYAPPSTPQAPQSPTLRTLCSWQSSDLPPSSSWWKASSYHLSIALTQQHFLTDPQKAAATFPGSVTMDITTIKDTACVLVAVATSVGITGVSLSVAGGPAQTLPVSALSSLPSVSDVLVLDLARTVLGYLPGSSTASLTLNYTAGIGAGSMSGTVGLWRSAPYDLTRDPNSPEQVMLTTELASGHRLARTLFPNLGDSPADKASYRVTVTAPQGMVVLNNMPAVSSQPVTGSDGQPATVTQFDRTLTMSPYLVAVAVGYLNRTSATANTMYQNKTVNVWTVPANTTWTVKNSDTGVQLGAQAAEYAARALEFYTQLIGVPQLMTVFNLVAVPGKTYATENWGLMMFDSQRLLFNPVRESAFGRGRCAQVVCHEVGHQWLGNMATMATDADLPVQEGLVSWLQYQCMQAVEPGMSARALSTAMWTPMGQPLGAHDGIMMQADMTLDAPDVTSIAKADALSGIPASDALSYAAMAQVVGFMQSVTETERAGLFGQFLARLTFNNTFATLSLDSLIQKWAETLVAQNATSSLPLSTIGNMTAMEQLVAAPWFMIHNLGHPVINVTDISMDFETPSDVIQRRSSARRLMTHHRRLLQTEDTTTSEPAPTPAPTPEAPAVISATSSPPPATPAVSLPPPALTPAAPGTTTPPSPASPDPTQQPGETTSETAPTFPAYPSHSSPDPATFTATQPPSTGPVLPQDGPPPPPGAPPAPGGLTTATNLQFTQERFCQWGVLSNTTDPNSLICPSNPVSGPQLWAIQGLASALVTSSAQYQPNATDTVLPWVRGPATMELLPASTQRFNVTLGSPLPVTTWIAQAGSFAEAQRVRYSTYKAERLLEQVAQVNLTEGLFNMVQAGVIPRGAQRDAYAWRDQTLVAIWSLISDIYALETSYQTATVPTINDTQPLILKAMESALSTQESVTGIGFHLLVLPTLDAYQRLAVLLGPNSTCTPYLRDWIGPYFSSRISTAIGQHFVAQFYNLLNPADPTNNGVAMQRAMVMAGYENATEVPQGPFRDYLTGAAFEGLFLYNLTLPRVLWQMASLDPNVASFVAGMLMDIAETWRRPNDPPSSWPAYVNDVNYQPAWEILAVQQPPGWNTTGSFINDLSLYQLEATAGTTLSAFADRERLLFARAHTRDADEREDMVLTVLAGLARNTSDPKYPGFAVSVVDATQLLKILTQSAQITGETNDVMDLLLYNAEYWPMMVSAFNRATGSSTGDAALSALSEMVSQSITTQQQYDALLEWLDYDFEVRGITAAALDTASPHTGLTRRQVLLGRAASNLKWKATIEPSMCAWLVSQAGEGPDDGPEEP